MKGRWTAEKSATFDPAISDPISWLKSKLRFSRRLGNRATKHLFQLEAPVLGVTDGEFQIQYHDSKTAPVILHSDIHQDQYLPTYHDAKCHFWGIRI